MKRIIIIGCPGSGKSILAGKLAELTGLPLYHLDMMYWTPDKTTVQKEVFRERLGRALSEDAWIIDGNYGSTMEMRLSACDTVIFLDYPTEVCLEGVRSRRGKARADMPWIEDGEDGEFMRFIIDYNVVSRPRVLDLLGKYPDKNIVILKNRREGEEFINSIR